LQGSLSKYKNIIFDLGGVVLDIDYNLTIEAFKSLGISDADKLYSKAQQNTLFDSLEKGNIDAVQFYDGMRLISGKQLSDEQIRSAWNALLIGLPEINIRLLRELKKTHRLFLLSNTNCIHEQGYREMISKQYGSFILDDLFEKSYLSHRIHMRKPDAEIFEYVLKDAALNRSQTFFIDDSPQHVRAALDLNIAAHHLQQPLTEYLK